MKKTYKFTGIDCAHCASELEKILRNSDGIEDAKVNFIFEKLIITSDSQECISNAFKECEKAFPEFKIEG